jgi:hypothetical protein
MDITSLKDERIQIARILNNLKGRLNSGKFLVQGIEAVHNRRGVGVLQIDKKDEKESF